MLDDESHQQEVDDFRERQKRRIEESDDEETGTAEREREALHPVDDALHSAECRLGPALVTTSVPSIERGAARGVGALPPHERTALLIASAALALGTAAASITRRPASR